MEQVTPSKGLSPIDQIQPVATSDCDSFCNGADTTQFPGEPKEVKTRILSGLAHDGSRLSRKSTRQSVPASPTKAPARWWSVRLFRGMIRDVRRRLPYFLSDWTDAWDYRVLPATVYMYFAKSVRTLSKVKARQPILTIVSILPALAFSLDMFEKTDMHYGVNEVLLASVLGAAVFSCFAAQPLVIVGVTGQSQSFVAGYPSKL